MRGEESMTKLPNKLSDLLMLALTDLEQVENDPRYKVSMLHWHEPNGKCSVCLAGSVMARTLRAPLAEPLAPSDFGSNAQKLRALDDVRTGRIRFALFQISGKYSTPGIVDYAYLDEEPSYAHDRAEWWLHMQSIVGILQAEGL